MDYLLSLGEGAQWEVLVEERTRTAGAKAAARGSSWEEELYCWVCLHDMLLQALPLPCDAGSDGRGAGQGRQDMAERLLSGGSSVCVPDLDQFLLSLYALDR